MQQPDVLGRRIGAAIIDLCVVIVIALVVGGIFGNDVASGQPASARFGTHDRLLIIVLAFVYFWISELLWGQTLGKRTLGIRVVRVDGSKATAGATFVRNLVRVVDFLPFFYIVGAITLFATGTRRLRLGDMAAKTRVVSATGPSPGDPSAPSPPSRPPDEDVLAQIMR